MAAHGVICFVGNTKEALEWAMTSDLWGHALFLSSKMGSRIHAQVLTRFANSSMTHNDPLQTLYQLMSNRQPNSATVSHLVYLLVYRLPSSSLLLFLNLS